MKHICSLVRLFYDNDLNTYLLVVEMLKTIETIFAFLATFIQKFVQILRTRKSIFGGNNKFAKINIKLQ